MKNKDKVYRNSLITCIVMLVTCVLFKLFGATLFDLDTNLPLLNKLNAFIMNNELMAICSFVLVFINSYLICILTTKNSTIKPLFFKISLFSLISISSKVYCPYPLVSFIVDTIGPFIICKTAFKETKIKEYFLVVILNLFYQMLSMFIKSFSYSTFYDTMTAIPFLTDYHIMLVITYLYLKKGGFTLWEVLFHHFGSFLHEKLCSMLSKNSKQCSKKEG